VRGNLAPPGVVTNGRANDWLKDRWQARAGAARLDARRGSTQAAKNMQGAAIPGPHWLIVDLGRSCTTPRG